MFLAHLNKIGPCFSPVFLVMSESIKEEKPAAVVDTENKAEDHEVHNL